MCKYQVYKPFLHCNDLKSFPAGFGGRKWSRFQSENTRLRIRNVIALLYCWSFSTWTSPPTAFRLPVHLSQYPSLVPHNLFIEFGSLFSMPTPMYSRSEFYICCPGFWLAVFRQFFHNAVLDEKFGRMVKKDEVEEENTIFIIMAMRTNTSCTGIESFDLRHY